MTNILICNWIQKNIISFNDIKLHMLNAFNVLRFKKSRRVVKSVFSSSLSIIVKFVVYMTMQERRKEFSIAINVAFAELVVVIKHFIVKSAAFA
jgi:hypothetical protein